MNAGQIRKMLYVVMYRSKRGVLHEAVGALGIMDAISRANTYRPLAMLRMGLEAEVRVEIYKAEKHEHLFTQEGAITPRSHRRIGDTSYRVG